MSQFHEITVEKLKYSGSDIRSVVKPMVPDSFEPKRLRLDIYVDDEDAREIFLITRHLDELGNGCWKWELDRKWPWENQIKFELWVTSTDPPWPPEEAYTQTDKRLWEKTLTSTSDGSFSPLQDLEIPYTVENAPDPVTVEIENPDGNGMVSTVMFPQDVRSALDDFARNDDDGIDFLVEDDVTAVAEDLCNRVDETGADGKPDGFPDTPMDVADQDEHGYCGPTALFLAMGVQHPRRAVEYCRTVYQSEAYDNDGNRIPGLAAKSADVTISLSKSFYDEQIESHERTSRQATADVFVKLMRYWILGLPPNSGHDANVFKKDQYRDPSGGELQALEMGHLIEEIVGIEFGGWLRNTNGFKILEAAGQWAKDGKSAVLSIDSTLVRSSGPKTKNDLDNYCYPEVDIDHVITVLSVVKGDDPVYSIDYQNPWGGQVDREIVEKEVLDKYVTRAISAAPRGD